MSKAAIYCRLSEEDRDKKNEADDSGSIQNQKAMLLEYAAQHSWEVYDIYSDGNYTGSGRNRPAFTRILEDAEVHRFDIILCKSQSRFTRELELVEKYINGLFPTWDIRFISLVDNADTSNKGNKKARQINGLVNEWYLEDMSENIRAVLTSRRKGGFHIGAFAPYGYKRTRSKEVASLLTRRPRQWSGKYLPSSPRDMEKPPSPGCSMNAASRIPRNISVSTVCGISSQRAKPAPFGNTPLSPAY